MQKSAQHLAYHLSKLQGQYVVWARRSTGSCFKLHFGRDLKVGLGKPANTGSRLLVLLSDWIITLPGVEPLNQDSDTGLMDIGLPRLLDRQVGLVQLKEDGELRIDLDGATIWLAPQSDESADDEAWIFFNEDGGLREAWTCWCNGELS